MNTIEQVRLGVTELHVSSFERSLPFYTDILGFTLLEQTDSIVTLGSNAKEPILVLKEDVQLKEKPDHEPGLYHFAVLLPTRKNLGTWLAHVIKKGYPLIGASDHFFSEAIYLSDPDGIGVEIYADRPQDIWVGEHGELKGGGNAPLDGDGLLQEAADSTWEGLPAGTVMGHLHFHLNPEEADSFYVNTLGFHIRMAPPASLFVAGGIYHHHLAFNAWGRGRKGAIDPRFSGIRSYTLVFPKEDDRTSVVERLTKAGVHMNTTGKSNEFIDPFGVLVRLQIEETDKKEGVEYGQTHRG
ncbi:VOC family protein [Bacillus altitudinis]|uniref:VOC family protein n=1 Tax=Bacillus altitudinis TaxID=293387 RepID=UPI001BA6E0F6|nr:VOC family protein [Bacillus altitudinis]MBR0632440.1 VOC family protein [Bacillus altitudinis C101]